MYKYVALILTTMTFFHNLVLIFISHKNVFQNLYYSYIIENGYMECAIETTTRPKS